MRTDYLAVFMLAFIDLHGIGYLHRDVKPGNYTVGRPELQELRKVYILDFGMCRKFTNDQVRLRVRRYLKYRVFLAVHG